MKSFEDNRVLRQPLTPALLSTVRVIGEYKGKQELWQKQFPEVLNSLRELAIIHPPSRRTGWNRLQPRPERLRDLMLQTDHTCQSFGGGDCRLP